MQITPFAAIVVIFICSSLTSLPAEAEEIPLQINVTTQSGEFDPAAPIDLIIAVKNRSDKRQTFSVADSWISFSYHVVREKNAEVSLTAWGKDKTPPGRIAATRAVAVKLEPGEAKKFGVRINHLFDMSLTGKYTIHVSRTYWGPEDPKFTSDSVSVKVRFPEGEK